MNNTRLSSRLHGIQRWSQSPGRPIHPARRAFGRATASGRRRSAAHHDLLSLRIGAGYTICAERRAPCPAPTNNKNKGLSAMDQTRPKDGAGAPKVVKSEAEWRAELTPAQFHVTRQAGTERPGTGPWLHEKRAGHLSLRRLRAAAVPLRDQVRVRARGWPSFYRADRRRGGRGDHRPVPRHGPHRGALRRLRVPSRPRLPRRAAADRPSLLHERNRIEA